MDLAPNIAQGDLSFIGDAESWFYNECSSTQQVDLSKQLQSHAWKSFLSPVTYTAWRYIPCTFLLCEKDQALPLVVQNAMVEVEGNLFEVERCDADHSPFVSRPERTAEVIRKAAQERMKEAVGTGSTTETFHWREVEQRCGSGTIRRLQYWPLGSRSNAYVQILCAISPDLKFYLYGASALAAAAISGSHLSPGHGQYLI